MISPDEVPPPDSAIDLALALEPDLRLLEGIATVLRHLGQGCDPVEPGAIAALAISAHEPITRMTELRHAATRIAQNHIETLKEA